MAWYNSAKDAGKVAGDAAKVYKDPLGITGDNSLSNRIFGGKAKGPADPQAQLDQLLAQIAADNEKAIAGGQSIYDQGYQGAEYSGDFNPEAMDLNSLAQLEDSALAGISVDPQFRAKELGALNRIEERMATGFTAEDEAALANIARDAARTNRGAQSAIESNFAQRGMGGAGMEFAARQQAAQDAAEMEGLRGLEVAAMAQRNQQAAANDVANLAGRMGDTDYGRASQAAQAQDMINRFNAQNRVNVQMQNQADKLNAQQSNLNRRDGLSQFNSSGLNNFNQNQIDFGMNSAQLRNQASQMKYDSITDAYNRAAAAAAEKNAARANRKAGMLGAAGAVAGVAGGGGAAGANAGYTIGSGLGKAF